MNEEMAEGTHYAKHNARFWTVREPQWRDGKLYDCDVLVGMCIECGEPMPEKIIKEVKLSRRVTFRG